MSGFSADWLARREPQDRRARNAQVLASVARSLAAYPSAMVVDLACGTGATLRAISSALPRRQNWRLVDNDLSLLARVEPPVGAELTVSTIPVDLAHDLEAALDGPVDLVTTSAFLDLVSESWLERLVTEIAARNLPFYAALSFDGRLAIDPVDDADQSVFAGLSRHQCSDKGFGPALGPAAATTAITLFKRIGYSVEDGRSDWILEPGDPLQAEFLAGIAAAALEIGDPASVDIKGWIAQRQRHIDAQRLSLRVGHIDFFASPSGRR